jgi:hypothetical protein
MTNPNKTDHAGPASSSTDQLERAEFEAFVGSPPYEYDTDRYPDNEKYAWSGQYRVIGVELAWESWKEAKRREREACAKLCETAEVPIDIDVWMGTKKALTAATAIGLATAIRKRPNAAISPPRGTV